MYQMGMWRLNKARPLGTLPSELNVCQWLKWKRSLLGVFVFLFISASWVYAYIREAETNPNYQEESEVEVLATAGISQSSSGYNVISTISQPTPLTALSLGYVDNPTSSYRVYPGYESNLNSRIIAQYGLLQAEDTGPTDADIDADENTQVAGVYFPLALIAYDGYGQTALSDSGTQLDLTVNPSLLNFEASQLTLDHGIANVNAYETAAGKYSLAVSATDVRNKSAVLNLEDLEIKPAWINNYTVSASSPQKQGVMWSERVFSWDAYGNLVKDWEYFSLPHFDPAEVQLQESVEYSPLCSLQFYPDLGSPSSGGSQKYTLEKAEGRAFAYIMANAAGNAQIFLNESQSYDYVIGPSTPTLTTFEGTSNTIVIQPINWLIDAQFVYDYTNEVLKASGWLERDGGLVSTVSGDSASIYIYNTQGTQLLTQTLSVPADLGEGQSVYQFSWSDIDLDDPTYFAKLVITHSASPYTSNFSFNLDAAYEFTQTINQELVVRTPQIETALEETADEVYALVTPLTDEIRQQAARVLVASETTIPSHIESTRESLTELIKAGVLNAPTMMQQGKEYLVNFQTYSGVSPVIDVYDPDGNLMLQEQAMEEIEDSGVYRAKVTFESSWPRGNYTLVCSEPTHGTMDASSVLVSLADLEDISRDTSAILGATAGVQGVKDLTADIEAALYALQMVIEEIYSRSTTVVRDILITKIETSGITELKESSEKLYESLLEIKRRIEEAGVVSRPVIEAIASFDETKKTDIDYLKEKFIQVEAVLRLHNQILDTYANKPVVETWYEFR